jgi:hypothetical protein
MSNKVRPVAMTEREARYWAGAATRQLRSMVEPAGLFRIGGKPVQRVRRGVVPRRQRPEHGLRGPVVLLHEGLDLRAGHAEIGKVAVGEGVERLDLMPAVDQGADAGEHGNLRQDLGHPAAVRFVLP